MQTEKQLEVTMPDGSIWAVPVAVIARSRAAHYAHLFDGDHAASLAATMRRFEENPVLIENWSRDCMIWEQVAPCAIQIRPPIVDRSTGWHSGPRAVAPLAPAFAGFELPGA